MHCQLVAGIAERCRMRSDGTRPECGVDFAVNWSYVVAAPDDPLVLELVDMLEEREFPASIK